MNQSPAFAHISNEIINEYIQTLLEQERCAQTAKKYRRDLIRLMGFSPDGVLTKSLLVQWKETLILRYAPATVNTILAAVNGFLKYIGAFQLQLKPLRIQRSLFCKPERELTRNEYTQLVKQAMRQNDIQTALIIQTICSTGIRVSELQFITAEAVKLSYAQIRNKGKIRYVFLPKQLCQLLTRYLKQHKKKTGPVFTTRTGRPIHRINIWKSMKKLCSKAGIACSKVFPHNLRHLFARTHYAVHHNLGYLADILGHSDTNTTRIYTIESGITHAKQVDRLNLLVQTTCTQFRFKPIYTTK